MEIIRKYKKLSTWDFLELVDNELAPGSFPSLEEYISYLDELKMRAYESISEGEIYKIKLRIKRLSESAQDKLSEAEVKNFLELSKEISAL